MLEWGRNNGAYLAQTAICENKRQAEDHHDSHASTVGTTDTVSMDGLLRLWPQQLEEDLWRSSSAVKLLRMLDCICLTNSVVISAVLLRTFGVHMSAYDWFQGCAYAVASAIQLVVMFMQRDLYQRHRFKVTLLNRCLRLYTVTLAFISISPQSFRRFSNTFASEPQHRYMPFINLLRYVVVNPLWWLNHSNFVLPFPYVLLAQLVTCAAVCAGFRVSTCFLLERPEIAQAAQQLCQYLKFGMHYSGMFLGRSPKQAAAAAALECQGVEGLVLLSMYANVLILLMLPCCTIYFVELKLKLGFIKQQGLTLPHAPPCFGSPLSCLVVVYGTVVGAWMASEVAVLVISPMHCDASHMLVMHSRS